MELRLVFLHHTVITLHFPALTYFPNDGGISAIVIIVQSFIGRL